MNTVKTQLLLSAAAAILGGLTACNKDFVEEPSADNTPDNAVRITASIGYPFSTRSTPLVDDAKGFVEGDEIFVLANEIGAGTDVYQAANTYRLNKGKWSPTDGNYILWKADELHFNAYYPASIVKELLEAEGTLDNFLSNVPIDQSSKEKIAKADLMIMEPEANFNKTQAVNIQMQHKTVKVTVNIKGFKNQYDAGAKVENLRFVASSTVPSVTEVKEYLPYTESDGSVGSAYTILLPYISATNLKELKVSMQPKGYNSVAADLSSFYGGTEYGKHYVVNITVGKDRLEVGEVTVADWGGSQELPGGNATKLPVLSTGTAGYIIVNLDYAQDFDEVKAALAGYFALSAGAPEHKFQVKGSAQKLFKDGHSVFHDTDATEIELWDVTEMTEIANNQFNGGAGGDNILHLKMIGLPKSVTVVGENAFANNTELQTVLCSNAKILRRAAFQGCTSLTDIMMPMVTELGENCFCYCAAIRTLNFDTPITKWGANAVTPAMARNIELSLNSDQKALGWNPTQNAALATDESFSGWGNNSPFSFGEGESLVWKLVKKTSME